ncbi:MAG: O-methyltransferase [Flavicella sp.]
MVYRIKAYFSHLIKSSNQHGVHSPFVYNLVTKCFYAKSSRDDITFFRNYKKSLLDSSEIITVEDFGAGSRIFKSKQRSISQIAKVASISKKYALLLMRMVEYFEAKNILEIGTSLGVSTACISYKNRSGKTITLEGCNNTASIAKNRFEHFGLVGTDFTVGRFESTLHKALSSNIFDFIYFDGNHAKDATLSYFTKALEHKHNNSIFVFDDIHWSKEMTNAWDVIKAHDEVTVSITTFQWGIVFFRKEQRKEHFTIRI